MVRNLEIGFVILTWNSEKVIGPCLKSIFEMNGIDSQVVIVDNGSSDQTTTIISDITPKEGSSLKLIRGNENRGTTVTRNEGLKYIRNFSPDYYCVLDSDTVISEKSMDELVAQMEQHREYGIIGPKMVTSKGLVQMSARSFPTIIEKICKAMPIKSIQSIGENMEEQKPKNIESSSYPVDYLMSACWLIRPEALDKAGYLDEKIFYAPEDAEYCIRMWKCGYSVAYCPKAQIIHEWQRLSKRKMISKMNYEHIKGLIYMFKKHHYAFSAQRMKKKFPLLNDGE